MVVTNMSSSSPAITNYAYGCSVSYPTVKVFEMLFWKPKLTRLGDTTLDLESMLPRVVSQMPIRSVIIAFSRSKLFLIDKITQKSASYPTKLLIRAFHEIIIVKNFILKNATWQSLIRIRHEHLYVAKLS